MQWRSAIAIVAGASTVSGVAGVPLFAQSDTRATRDAHASTVLALNTHAPVLRVYGSEQSLTNSIVAIPANLTFPDFVRPMIESMLERSATFRRQCLRIGRTPKLLVQVTTVQTNIAAGARARTKIGRTADGRVTATVTIKRIENLPELIAHELEHVIEQLDGVDLRTRSALSGTGVWNCGDGSFETTRAVRIGRAVFREMTGDR
jgi:hypothetical protein